MSTMTEDQTYNGWKNYPTWAVNLWLSNDERLYHATLERVKDAQVDHDSEYVRVETADAIQSFVRDDLMPDLDALIGASFVNDLLGYALDTVDWFEIADAWLEIASEQD